VCVVTAVLCRVKNNCRFIINSPHRTRTAGMLANSDDYVVATPTCGS